MNEIIQSIEKRKSVRVFEEKKISEEIKNAVFSAAFHAPTAGCQMLYSIIDVTNQELKEKLAVTCDNQPFIAKAPLVLIFLADCRRWFDSYRFAGCDCRKPTEGDLLLACSDALIAAQNSVIAAESFGLGSCYIGDIMENIETHRELLGLDDYVYPATMVVYGYPAKSQRERKKPQRFEKEYIVFENTYQRLSEEKHREMFCKWAGKSGKINFSFDEYVQAFCKRKYMSDFSEEMTRSAREYLKNFK